MIEFIRGLFSSNFMPHGQCYLWQPEILWLHAISDGAIALAYYAIPFFLLYIVQKRRDLVFPWIFVMFGAFILLCGTTHVLSIWSIWHGTYWFTGSVKAVTGVVSVATAIALVPLVPRVLSLVSPEQLQAANDALRQEVEARERAEQALRELNRDLEQRVQERTVELEQANTELLELNQTLEARVAERTEELSRSNARLEERNEELKSFAYVASHDLQEPLRKITSFADLLEDEYVDALPEEGHFYVDRIRDAGKRMSRLINDLLAYSRVSTQARDFEQVSLNELVGDVQRDLEIAIEEADANVEVDPLPTIEADPTQIRQVFQNLISNAVKFRRPQVQPRIRIRAEETDRGDEPARCRIIVEDNGIGFEQQHAEDIFRPFRRLHGRSEYQGSGIGLAIVQQIIRRHKGDIQVRSAPGEGATFTITLPYEQPKSG